MRKVCHPHYIMQIRQKTRLLGFALGLLTVSTSAMAGLNQVAVGVAFPQLTKSYSQKLETSPGYHLDVYFDRPAVAGQTSILFRGIYQQFDLKNLASTSLPTFSLLGGFETQGQGALLGISPLVSVLVGGTYATYDYSVSAGTTDNSGLYFTTQLSAGFEFPVYGPVSGAVTLPIQFVFAKPVLTTWSQMISLRWAL